MIVERAIMSIKPGASKADFAAAYAAARPHIEAAKGFRKIEMRQGVDCLLYTSGASHRQPPDRRAAGLCRL